MIGAGEITRIKRGAAAEMPRLRSKIADPIS